MVGKDITINEYKKRRFFLSFLVLSCFIAFVNVMFRSNYILSLLIVVLEIIILVILLFLKKIKDYLCFYIVFMSNCLEFDTYVGEEIFYGLKNFRIFGVNLGALLLIPLIIYGFFRLSKFLLIEKKNKTKFVSVLLSINIIAAITGFLLILFNDNSIRSSFENIFTLYIGKMYEMLLIPLALGLTLPSFVNDRVFSLKMSLVLQCTLLASLFQIFVSVIFKQYGNYSTLDTLQVSVTAFFVPFLMLAPMNKRICCFPKITFILSFFGSLLYIFYNPSGKGIIVFVIVVLVYLIQTLKNGTRFEKIFSVFVVVAGLLFVPFLVSQLLNSQLFRTKLIEAQRMLNVFSENWLTNMPLSPRIRIEEFRSVFSEFLSKPFLAFFGKGFLGSIVDSNGFFAASVTSTDEFVSKAELMNGIYFNLHEGSSMLLTYGFFGVGFVLYVFIKSIRAFLTTRNMYCFIGAVWFLLFYGYSFTMSIFGFACVVFGLYCFVQTSSKTIASLNNKSIPINSLLKGIKNI